MFENKWHTIEMRDNRYNQIVHMVSAANGAEEFYSCEVCVKNNGETSISYMIYLLKLIVGSFMPL